MATQQRSMFELFNKMVVNGLRNPDPSLPVLTGSGNLNNVLGQLNQATIDVVQSASLTDWLTRSQTWRNRLEDVADAAFSGSDRVGQLFARVLQSEMPRLASYFSLKGVIVSDAQGTERVDWNNLANLFKQPSTLIDEQLWSSILGQDAASGAGRRPAILAALLILAPRTIQAMVHSNLKVAALPAPETRTSGDWRNFRQATENWISVTFPFGDPTATHPNPDTIYDLVSRIQPDFAVTLAGMSDRVSTGGGNFRTDFEFWLALALNKDKWKLDFGNDWLMEVTPGVSFGFGRHGGNWDAAFRAFSTGQPATQITDQDPLCISVRRDTAGGEPDILLGPPYDTRLEIQDINFFLKLRPSSPIIEIGAETKGLALVLTNRWFRTFGISDTIFREGIRYDANLKLAYVEGKGFRYNLGSTLDILFNIDWRIGSPQWNFKLHSIRLTVPIDASNDGFRIRAELRFHVSFQLSQYAGFVLDGFGGWGGYWRDPVSNPNSERQYAGALPPTGAGVEFGVPSIAYGGGYLERKELPDGGERWAGAFWLRIYSFGVRAFGIYEKKGDGQKSYLLILGIRYYPGIQLGYGFAITGIGGVFGFDRRIDTDALRERLTSGAAGNVLFLEDPIKNAPTIIGDLVAIFPAADGVYVFGPTAQITWLSLGNNFYFALLDVGIVIELPGPSKIILLGSLKALIVFGNSLKMVYIRLDFVGILDFEKKILEFDASLINSMALEVLHITGDAAFRTHWGENPYALLSIGGFHPNFDPAPIIVPEMTRVALTQSPGFFGTGVHLRFEAYLAVTTNTFQVGAAIEIGWKFGPFNAIGFISFDALIQFSPFHFEIAFRAGVRLRWNAVTLAGIRLEGVIEGPGPVKITGRACIEILFFDICAKGSITFGSDSAPSITPVASLVSALAGELDEPSNLEAFGGDDQLVTLSAPPADTGTVLVSPVGQLVWRETRAPFNVILDRFESVPLTTPQAVVVSSPHEQAVFKDWFSAGQSMDLTDAEALNRAAFERMQAGIRLGFDGEDADDLQHRSVDMLTIKLPQNIKLALSFILHPSVISDAVMARGAKVEAKPMTAQVTSVDETWTVHANQGGILHTNLTQTDAHQRARYEGGVAVPEDDSVEIGGF